MPTDSNGVHSLPAGYLAVNGETVLPSNHNPPMEDISEALTARLPRNGAAPMTAALKLFDGTVTAPGMAFNTATGTGFYKTTAGFGVSIGGVQVAEFGAGGIISGAVPIGAGMDWWLPTAPAGWVFPYGQACTTAYPILRQKFIDAGNPHGVSGSDPLFPNKANRLSIPKGDMSGTDVALITTAGSGIDGKTLGAIGGAQSRAITQGELPAVAPTFTGSLLTVNSNVTDVLRNPSGVGVAAGAGANGVGSGVSGLGGYTISSTGTPAGTISNLGSGTAHPHMPPGIVCNYIIFAGA